MKRSHLINMGWGAIGLLILGFLVSCEEPDENFDWKPGSELIIHGSKAFTVNQSPDTTSTFNVAGYTINKTYNWSVNGPSANPTSGEGETFEVTFAASGTYTISVDNGDDAGDIEVNVTIQ